MKARISVALAIGLISLVIPAPVGAATTIGQTGPPVSFCSSDTTFLQSSEAPPGDQYTVPAAGVLTSWSVHASASPNPFRFKVGRPAGGGVYSIVGQSDLETLTPGVLNTFGDIRIPVQAGDVIGFFIGSGGDAACGFSSSAGVVRFLAGDVPSGDPMTFGSDGGIMNVSARLEPDCDTDGFGDETQDASVLGGDCPARGRTVTLDASKNKVKKRKRVTFSGRVSEVVRQGECQATQLVVLQRKRPKNTAFATVEQLQTDAAGSFSARVKVKRTLEFRAQLPPTPTCGEQVSNIEKVKAKKKK